MTAIITAESTGGSPPAPQPGIQTAAADLIARGFAVCRLLPGEKRPTYPGWTTRSLAPDDFGPGDNIGVLGGWLSDGGRPGHALVIIDLDHPDAVARADEFLPATGVIEGRAGKPQSHRYFLVPVDSIPPAHVSQAEQAAPAARAAGKHPGAAKKVFKLAATGKTAIDVIGTGGQVACPPSVHPSGEGREWEGGSPGIPAVVSFSGLWAAVSKLADAIGCKPPKVGGAGGAATQVGCWCGGRRACTGRNGVLVTATAAGVGGTVPQGGRRSRCRGGRSDVHGR